LEKQQDDLFKAVLDSVSDGVMEANLRRYLETERLLNIFFASFDYCASLCIGPAVARNKTEPVTACCRDRYYRMLDPDHPAFDLLRQERQRLYGKPEQYSRIGRSSCEYHDPGSGCVLTTHKSPTCLGFLCPKAVAALRSEYGIYAYDYLGVSFALEWILTGDLPDRQFHEFRQSIVGMTRKVEDYRWKKRPSG